MLLLIKWLCAHLIGDFALQTTRIVQQKRRLKAGSGYLYLHCLIHGALIYLFTAAWSQWLAPVAVAVTHYFIDLWKLHRKDNAKNFIIDQGLHLLVLFVLWLQVTHSWSGVPPFLRNLWQNTEFWAIVLGYATVIWPAAFLLGFATKRWRDQIADTRLSNGGKGSLSEAGKWIGIFERALVLTFIITNHYEGIGFLIAAKSILRFNDLKESENRRETEYVLIGTLMSFSTSIFIGSVVVFLLQ
ncbi:DUF3307 domain-containing protein [Chitinophaga barathri]|uniref:DUF3307 domain-containing protein n=1 Tax=Chitinophaga barathri TaxID=1647451 RepID=A0A3N4N3V4_9BACT|nr:DUF3307 domain-containing protein [Chitinophaga barathri]RPD42303.1 DUF3307 domain-containing protein [Chitinophaga barathri]